MKTILFLSSLSVVFLTACQGNNAGNTYMDDDGNLLTVRCDTSIACLNHKHGLIIDDLANPGAPNPGPTATYVFCCDTLKSVVDSLSEYAKLISECNKQYKGKKIGADDERPQTKYPRAMYFSDSNRITLAMNWKAEGDSITFKGLELEIGHAGNKVTISFNSQKTLEAFTNALQQAHINCCF